MGAKDILRTFGGVGIQNKKPMCQTQGDIKGAIPATLAGMAELSA
jgi:hypothetical protein